MLLIRSNFVDRSIDELRKVLDARRIAHKLEALTYGDGHRLAFRHGDLKCYLLVDEDFLVLWAGLRYLESIDRWESANQRVLLESFTSRLENYLDGRGWKTNVIGPPGFLDRSRAKLTR